MKKKVDNHDDNNSDLITTEIMGIELFNIRERCENRKYYVDFDSNYWYIRENLSDIIVSRKSRSYIRDKNIEIGVAYEKDSLNESQIEEECRLLNLKFEDRSLYIREIKKYEGETFIT